MTFQEFDQDDDCSHSILVTEGGGPGGDGPDWQPGTRGISASVLEVFAKIMWIVWISPIFRSTQCRTSETQKSTKGIENLS